MTRLDALLEDAEAVREVCRVWWAVRTTGMYLPPERNVILIPGGRRGEAAAEWRARMERARRRYEDPEF